MKKIFFILASVILSGVVFNGCKKGENDPFLSLSSRKARLAGEWKLTKSEQTTTFTDATGTDTYVTTFDGTNKTNSMNGTAGTPYAYSETVSIDKKGSFKTTTTSSSSGTAVTNTDEGQWYFAGKNKEMELKNKEAVIFAVLKSSDPSGSTTWTGVYADAIWVIDQLKSKEMIIKMEYTSVDSDGDTDKTVMSMTYTQ